MASALGTTQHYSGCCNNNGALMAGLAYDANTKDIRPDDATKPQHQGQADGADLLARRAGIQHLQVSNNQFYLAAKYGGFNVPDDLRSLHDSRPTSPRPGGTPTPTLVGGQKRPDTYYTAAGPTRWSPA